MPSALSTQPSQSALRKALNLPAGYSITQKISADYRADGRAHARMIYALHSPTHGAVPAYVAWTPVTGAVLITAHNFRQLAAIALGITSADLPR